MQLKINLQGNTCLKNYLTSKKQYKTYNDKALFSVNILDDGIFVLADGSTILLENMVLGERLYITVDVNGINKYPNQLGQDTAKQTPIVQKLLPVYLMAPVVHIKHYQKKIILISFNHYKKGPH